MRRLSLMLLCFLLGCTGAVVHSVLFSCRRDGDCREGWFCASDGACHTLDDLPPLPLRAPIDGGVQVVATSSRLVVEPRGGTPPFSLQIVSGAGLIDGLTFEAPEGPQLVTVRIVDARQETVDVSLAVIEQTLQAGGLYHFCKVVHGRVKCWGYNVGGILGLGDGRNRGDDPDEMGAALPFVDLGVGRTVVSIAAGTYFSCALFDTLEVKCWGENGKGQLGVGDVVSRGRLASDMGDALPVVDVGTGRRVLALGAGQSHVCVLLDDRSVKCWGEGGLLGLGDSMGRGQRATEMGDALPPVDVGPGGPPIQLDVGATHTCVLNEARAVKCWGHNDFGELLVGDVAAVGDGPGEMGVALRHIAWGRTASVRRMFVGPSMTCATFTDDTTKCGGAGASGQLGTGSTPRGLGDTADELGDGLPALDLGADFVVRSMGFAGVGPATSVCAVSVAGLVKCWGANASGELGQGDTLVRGGLPGTLGDALPPVRLGVGARVDEVAGSSGTSFGRSFCARLSDGRLKCWGNGSLGQLGAGAPVNVGDEADEMGDALPVVSLE